jgi:hypothetical protein
MTHDLTVRKTLAHPLISMNQRITAMDGIKDEGPEARQRSEPSGTASTQQYCASVRHKCHEHILRMQVTATPSLSGIATLTWHMASPVAKMIGGHHV